MNTHLNTGPAGRDGQHLKRRWLSEMGSPCMANESGWRASRTRYLGTCTYLVSPLRPCSPLIFAWLSRILRKLLPCHPLPKTPEHTKVASVFSRVRNRTKSLLRPVQVSRHDPGPGDPVPSSSFDVSPSPPDRKVSNLSSTTKPAARGRRGHDDAVLGTTTLGIQATTS
ncbi:hypothetical protein LX36DRAFT_439177 [Colletotrichum falcatum]|nr:hypothetical protein LX36DRAFT_439177 [Colletotrichum falcatum]